MQVIEDFENRLKTHGEAMFDLEKHAAMIKQLYYIEENWTEIIPDIYLTPRMKEQQSCIWELLTTERNYICKMRLIWEVGTLVNQFFLFNIDTLESPMNYVLTFYPLSKCGSRTV